MAFFKLQLKKCNLLQNYATSLVKPFRNITEKSVTETGKISSPQDLIKNSVKTTAYSKWLMAWSGLYKKTSEVPDYVSFEAMQKARNKVRIKFANYMMAATVLGCIVMTISGKKAAKGGESVTKMNLDWHKEYNEQAKAEANKN